MRPIGKTAPTTEGLQRVADDGFRATELYLEDQHLQASMPDLIERLRAAPVAVDAVHTPHSRDNDMELFRRTSRLCRELDALLAFHSQYLIEPTAIQVGAELDVPAIAYENQAGTSRRAIEGLLLDQGHGLVLDTAHLFMATDQFQADLRALADRADHVHLCDGTVAEDGLALGDGEIDIGPAISALAESAYDGPVTLEVPVDRQQEALRRFQDHGDTA